MSTTPPTQKFFIPTAPESRRKPKAASWLLMVVAVIVAGLVGVLLTQVQSIAAAESAEPVESAQAIVVESALATTGIEAASAAPEPQVQQSAELPPSPAATATVGPTPTLPPAPAPAPAPAPQPSGDLSDQEEDALEPGPQGEDVPPGNPAPPAQPVEPAPVAPAPPIELEPVEPAPFEPTPIDNPCVAVLANGENLLVEDPIMLAPGALSSAITIHNCGDAPVDWTAATKPWVALASNNGNLTAGSTTELVFDIDRDSVDVGAFEFKIKVSEPGSNTYVDVTGVRTTVGLDHVVTDQLKVGQGAGPCANGCGSFAPVTPATPVTPPKNVAPGPGGCANQCITKAVISFGADPTNLMLDAMTTTPAHLVAFVSTQAPIYSGGEPTFSDVDASSATNGFVIEWDTNITGLTPATNYHIIVRATDENGKSAHQVGAFTSPASPVVDETVDVLIVPLKLTVTNDGDNIGRGELRFAWQVGDKVGNRAEQRMNDGDSFLFPFFGQTYLHDLSANDVLPSVVVTAFERDPDGKVESNNQGTGPIASPSHGLIDSTDEKYNTATSGINTVGGLESAARCSSFGITGEWANYPCALITTAGYGNDYPEFQAVIAYQVASDLPNPVPGG